MAIEFNDDIATPVSISFKKSLQEKLDDVRKERGFNSISQYMSFLVEKDINTGRYDNFVKLFSTLGYPLIIFIMLIGFTFITTGFIAAIFFLFAIFSGIMAAGMFFYEYNKKKTPKTKG